MRAPGSEPDESAAGTPRTAAGRQKRLVVLVHGIGGDARTWEKLLDVAKSDPALAEFRFEPFVYATGVGRLHPLRQLPTLATVAANLRGFLESGELAPYRDVRLVGHSQGGLVIQRYLQDMLTHKRGSELDRIRQVIFFATPTLGSGIASGLRRVAFALVSNPQERELRPFNPIVADTRRFIQEHVSRATELGPTDVPIPIHVF